MQTSRQCWYRIPTSPFAVPGGCRISGLTYQPLRPHTRRSLNVALRTRFEREPLHRRGRFANRAQRKLALRTPARRGNDGVVFAIDINCEDLANSGGGGRLSTAVERYPHRPREHSVTSRVMSEGSQQNRLPTSKTAARETQLFDPQCIELRHIRKGSRCMRVRGNA